MSKEFEKQHPRRPNGEFDNKHKSVKPTFELATDAKSMTVDERIEAAGDSPDALALLRKDPDYAVRERLANKGRKEDLDVLVDDESVAVRETVARVGDAEHLAILRSGPHPLVRAEVARRGRDEDLDVLVDDKSAWVREMVAERGRRRHLMKLQDDPNVHVRKRAKDMSIVRAWELEERF